MNYRTPMTSLRAVVFLLAWALAASGCERKPPGGGAGGSTQSGSGAGGTRPCSGGLGSDPANCGACGHDCVGGACKLGVCQPIVLGADTAVWDIALDADHVYWTQYSGPVMKIPKAGGTAMSLGIVGAYHIALADGQIYVAGFDLLRLPVEGGTPTVLVAAAGPTDVATDGAEVYFFSREGFTKLSLQAIPVAGGAVSVLWSGSPPAGALDCHMQLALDRTSAYWVPACNGEAGCELPGGWVRRTPLAGGPSTTLLSDLVDEELLAIDDTHLYVALNAAGCGAGGTRGLLRIPLDGGAQEWITQGQLIYGVAVDRDHVYWSEQGKLYSKPKLGGELTVLDTVTATALTLDEAAVYYGDVDGTALKRVAKP